MIRSRRQLYFITWCTACRRYLFEQNKDSSRYLEFRGWHTGSLFIVEQNCDDDQDTVMHVDKPRMEYTRGIAGEEDGASNQTDRSSCFRSGTKPFHLFVRLAFFFLVFRRTRTTIDTWRGRRWRGRRSREPALDKEERESERAKRRKRGSRVAPHILLISVSIVVSVGTPSLRARGAGWRGTIHHLVLRFAHVPLFSFSSSSSSYSLLLTLVVPDLSHSLHRRSLKTLAIMASFPLKREKR